MRRGASLVLLVLMVGPQLQSCTRDLTGSSTDVATTPPRPAGQVDTTPAPTVSTPPAAWMCRTLIVDATGAGAGTDFAEALSPQPTWETPCRFEVVEAVATSAVTLTVHHCFEGSRAVPNAELLGVEVSVSTRVADWIAADVFERLRRSICDGVVLGTDWRQALARLAERS